MSASSLVPAVASEFNKSTYWESFFKKRVRAFEWYGTYHELCGILHRYIKPTDNVLVAGCGNSELSENMYDAGLQNITNIDVSQTVIDQMTKRRGNRKTLEYFTMDLTDLKFKAKSFSVIVDKATLDAVMSDDSARSHELTNKIFAEYSRVIKNGGRYICVTLAQNFILKKIMDYFPANEWLIRLHRVFMSAENSSNDLPVFAFVMTKFKNLPRKIMEICSDDSFTPKRVENEAQIIDFVTSQQYYVALKSSLAKEIEPGKENPAIELFTTKNSTHPRFVMHVVDKSSCKPHCMFAVFIVPQGRENEWLFSTHEGRLKVADQTNFKRVLFVSLHPNHEYGSRDDLNKELNSTVMDFAPPGIKKNDDVPYLSTTAEDIGQRVVRFRGESEVTGPYVVEDYLGDGEAWYRHLLFTRRKTVIQCEVPLKEKGITNSGKRSNRSNKKTGDGKELVPDHTSLATQYSEALVVGLILRYKPEDCFKIMVIGVGGGTSSSFLLHHFKNCHVTAVEIDPTLIEIGHEWFGLPKPGVENRLELKTADGLQFVHQERKKLEEKKKKEDCEKGFYDVIFLDVDAKDPSLGISCPPPPFLEEDYLRSVISVLFPDGLFVINLLCRSEQLKSKVMYNLKRFFKVVGKFPCDSFYNEVIYCFKQKPTFITEKLGATSSRKQNRKKKSRKKKQERKDEPENTPIADGEAQKGDLEPDYNATNNVEDNLEKVQLTTENFDVPGARSDLPGGDCGVKSQSAHGRDLPEEQGMSPDYGSNLLLSSGFVPPAGKKPVRLQNYDSDLWKVWAENAAYWEKHWKEHLGSVAVDLLYVIESIVIEQEVDYYVSVG